MNFLMILFSGFSVFLLSKWFELESFSIKYWIFILIGNAGIMYLWRLIFDKKDSTLK